MRPPAGLAPGCAVLCLALGAFHPIAAAAAEPTGEKTTAGEYNRKAIEAFKKGDFEVAQENFDRALALNPDPKIRLNLAVTQENLHRFDEAKMHYEAYLLVEMGDKAQDVKRKLRALEQKMRQWGKVVLSVEPAPDLLELSGRKVTARPAKVWLEAGEHGLIIEKNGYRRVQRLVSVAPGQRLDLQIRLEELPAEAPPTTAAVPAPQATAPPAVVNTPVEPKTPAPQSPPPNAPAVSTPVAIPPSQPVASSAAAQPSTTPAAEPTPNVGPDRTVRLLRIAGVSALVVALVAGAATVLGVVVGGLVYVVGIVRPPGPGAALTVVRTVTIVGLLGTVAFAGLGFVGGAAALGLVVSAFLLE